MLSMSFMTQKVEGLEFIEFQRSDFYRQLQHHLEQFISPEGILDKACEPGLKEVIENYTGFVNLTFDFEHAGNFAVDVGYFSPNHVLNNQLVDQLLKTNQTTLYRWFKENKEKVFSGTIDYKTGKVGGSFKEVPVNFAINPNLHETFPKEKIAKFGIGLEGILSGAFAHELGHIFGACVMLDTSAKDNVLAKAALQFYTGVDKEKRIVVLKDVGSLLNVPTTKQAELEEIANGENADTVILYFDKLLAQRNTQRSLSVGVPVMTSEVVADMYAIRMGCDKGVIAAISILTDHGCIQTVLNSMLMAGLYSIIAGGGTAAMFALSFASATPAIAFLGTMFTIFFLVDYFSKGYSGVYNANHRRFDDAMRQLIAKFKEDKNLNTVEVKELVEEINKLREHNKKLLPWYDSTVIHRFVGWIFNGSDFKRQEIEHYTQVLANHEINIFTHQLNDTKA